MTEASDYSWLVQEAKKLAAECEFGQSTLIAAAVICLDRINDRLNEVVMELEMVSACLQKSMEDRE